jgi:ATP-binding cassette subfamily B protein/subfamily B ATP-binding cassette protein MsbA
MSQKGIKSIARVFQYVKRYPLLAISQLSVAVIGTLMVIVFPAVTREIIDEVAPKHAWDRLPGLICFALFAYAIQHGFNGLRIILNNTFEQKVIFDLRSDLYQRLQTLPLRWFDHRPTGDIMTTISEDVPSVERVLIDGIEQGVVSILQILVVGICLFLCDWRLALITLIPVPFLATGALLYTRQSRHRHRAVRKASSAMNSLLHDNIAGIRQIKSYALEDQEHARFNEHSGALRFATLMVMRYWAIYRPSMHFLSSIGMILVLWAGTQGLKEGRMSIGDLAAFLFWLKLFYDPIESLHQLNQIIQTGRAAGERVFEILDAETESMMDDGIKQSFANAHVVYENVSFGYGKIPTVRHIHLEAKPGQTVALVGPTGAGKSTVINLLTRFYEHQHGKILIDGHDISQLKKSSLREQIGYVTQESFMFNGTVRHNLLIAKADATEEELWRVLGDANANFFVEKLPEKLDTHVGERGVKLSVGEKQRLSIARALLRNPPILLLDEATASVDTETERLIQSALDRLMKGRTCFVIAHRLSTVRHADIIYVLKQGEVIEQGTHEELNERNGLYSELCKTSLMV